MPSTYLRASYSDRLRWVEKYPVRPLKRAHRRSRLVKRCADITIVLLSLPVWLSVIVVAAIAVKCESPRDPVFFVQNRTGRHGHRFRLYKLRTMHVGAEKLKKELQHLNIRAGGDFKLAHDPRVTRVGTLLRAFNIDELPQLLNVLLGDMSLVGPRPTSFGPDHYDVWHSERFDAVPGITGLWQLYQAERPFFDDRIRVDIAYLRRQCFWFDLELLFRTGLSCLSPRVT